eukprot:409332_1
MQRIVDYDRKAFLPPLCIAFYRSKKSPYAAVKKASSTAEKIYRSKDSAYWKKMHQYLAKQDIKESIIEKAIQQAIMKNIDPYDIVVAKQAKGAQKHKRPKPLTDAEKTAKRQHFWKKIEQVAAINRKKMIKHPQGKNTA